MMSGGDVARAIKGKMDEIKKYGVKGIGLFGSFARDEQGEGGDIDISVEFD
ncbi:MAG: nucleotidyltransferase domain-containing protein [Candidatus Bathyarchaeia archaeon]